VSASASASASASDKLLSVDIIVVVVNMLLSGFIQLAVWMVSFMLSILLSVLSVSVSSVSPRSSACVYVAVLIPVSCCCWYDGRCDECDVICCC
jgi:hypothetical protein